MKEKMTFLEFEQWLSTQGRVVGIPAANTGYYRGNVRLPNGKLQLITYFPLTNRIERD